MTIHNPKLNPLKMSFDEQMLFLDHQIEQFHVLYDKDYYQLVSERDGNMIKASIYYNNRVVSTAHVPIPTAAIISDVRYCELLAKYYAIQDAPPPPTPISEEERERRWQEVAKDIG